LTCKVENLQTKLKFEESSIILYHAERCLTNRHSRYQPKTMFIFVNWYQLHSSYCS